MNKKEDFSYIGQSVPRREDPPFLTGRGRYTEDIKIEGLTHAMMVRSQFAHARILSIDTSQAEALPGVLGVLTAADLIDVGDIMPNFVVGDSIIPPHRPLAADRARYVGEPIALVVAETREIAADALELVQIDYEPLPAVTDQVAALEPTAPQLHDNVPGNLIGTYKAGNGANGRYEAVAAAADRLVRIKLVNQRLIPSALEPRAIRAVFDSVSDKLTMYLPSQVPHMSRRWLAETLHWPEHRLQIVAPDIGGGFGSKMHFYSEEIALAFAAKHFERPVSWVETRSEAHMATTHGRAHVEDVEVPVTKEGKVLGIRLRSTANLGAYLSNMGTGIPTINTVTYITGNYDIPVMDGEVRLVTTNTTPVDAYRGAGRPEAAYIIERAMDAVANELKMDPLEVRRKNLITTEQLPYRPYEHPIFRWCSGDFHACVDQVEREIDYKGWRAKQNEFREQGRYVGIAITCYLELVGMGVSKTLKPRGFNRGGWESAQLRVHSDGKVTLFSGSMPQGHGHATSFAQIVADRLEMPIGDIDVVQGDTDRVPAGHGTFNSRSMSVGGSAAFTAAGNILEKARKIAAAMLDEAPEKIAYSAGVFTVLSDSAKSLTFAEVARGAYVAAKIPEGMQAGLDELVFYEPKAMNTPNGAHAAVVEVDIETGEVKILDYVGVDDTGVMINPMLCHGQMHGGLAQGIGQALYEGVDYDDDGQLLTGSLLDYVFPKSDQIPRMRTSFIIVPTPTNPLGVKGLGEAGCVAAPPTIVSAVCDALKPLGIQHIDMPLTPPRVWRAIRDAAKGAIK